MGDQTTRVISDTVERARNQMLALFNNLLAAFEELYDVYSTNKIREIYENIYLRQIPWEEKLAEFRSQVEELANDPNNTMLDTSREIALQILDQEIKRSLENDNKHKKIKRVNEYDNLVKIFQKSNLPADDKQICIDMVMAGKNKAIEPHALTLNAEQGKSSYRAFIALLKQNHLLSQVSMIESVGADGGTSYNFFYSGAIEAHVRRCAELASLFRGVLARPELADLEAFANADPKHPGKIIAFRGLSEELAEKAVMESTKTHTFSFAKQYNSQTDSYDIFCYGGSDPQESEHYYKQALSTIAQAAYSLTGPTGELEKQRTLHSAKEWEKIEHVIQCIRNDEPDEEDSGYVFSIQHLKDNDNNRFILADDYVKFDSTHFTAFLNGSASTVNMENCLDYTETLRLNIQSGPGQKVYISDKEMDQIRDKAVQAEKLLKSLPAGNSLDQIAYLQKALQETRDNLNDPAIATTEAARINLKAQVDIQSIALDTLLINPGIDAHQSKILGNEVLERAIGRALQEHEFKGYANAQLSKETVDQVAICNQAMKQYLDNPATYHNINLQEPSITDVYAILENPNYNAYYNELIDMMNSEGSLAKAGETITRAELDRQVEILDQNFAHRAENSKQWFDGISTEEGHSEAGTREATYTNTKNWRTKTIEKLKEILSQAAVDHDVVRDNEPERDFGTADRRDYEPERTYNSPSQGDEFDF